MDSLLPQVLSFVLASVIGYFFGRIAGIWDRDHQWFE
jgi:hypothetical protein